MEWLYESHLAISSYIPLRGEEDLQLQDSFDDFDSFLLESYVQYIFAILLFISLKKSTFETRKISFFILLKNLFWDWDIQVENLWIFEKLKFHDGMSFRIMKQEFVLNHWITKNILLNNLKSKHSVVCRITNKKFLFKDFYEKDCLKTSSRFFCVGKELSATSIEKWKFENKLIIIDM